MCIRDRHNSVREEIDIINKLTVLTVQTVLTDWLISQETKFTPECPQFSSTEVLLHVVTTVPSNPAIQLVDIYNRKNRQQKNQSALRPNY